MLQDQPEKNQIFESHIDLDAYFLSYSQPDKQWAEWIAWQLESAGLRTILQAWDFRPGTNFVHKMHEAASTAIATVAVVSRAYLQRPFPTVEWLAAFVKDADGQQRRLIPVRVEDVALPGLLAAVTCIDIFLANDEIHAKDMLFAGLDSGRAKPSTEPAFPARLGVDLGTQPQFPASTVGQLNRANSKIEVEIVLNFDFDKFDSKAQAKFLKAIKELLSIDNDLTISKIRKGSVVVTLLMDEKDALKLAILARMGKLFKVKEVIIDQQKDVSLDDLMQKHLGFSNVQPHSGIKETGKIVHLNERENFVIIERDLGGYLRFDLPKRKLREGAKFTFHTTRGITTEAQFPIKKDKDENPGETNREKNN